MKKIFFSYNFKDKDIVSGCYSVLANQTGCELFFFDKMVLEGSWKKDVKKAIQECDYFVLFMGEEYGKTQEKEVEIFEKRYPDLGERFIAVELLTYDSNKFDLLPPSRNIVKLEKDAAKKPEVLSCMKELVERCIGLTFNFFDDLPSNPHLFDYEKTIIDFYITKEKLSKLKIEKKIDNIDELPDEEINEIFSQISAQSDDVPEITPKQKKEKIREKYNYLHNKLLGGCPPKWPTLDLKQEDLKTNEINEFGKFRSHSACVVAAALSKYHQDPNFCMKKSKFVFPEAGPREKLYFPKYSRNIPFRVGVLVSGGIAPGINAVIDGITQRHYKYFETEQNRTLEIWGLKNGFQGFGDFPESKYILKHKEDEANRSNLLVTSNHVNEGGSILGTSRYEALLSGEKRMETLGKIVEKLRSNHVRILYIIGGDGSMKAAHALSYIAKEKFETSNWNLSVIGIPKTMDNDILWVWQTFGFLSAVEKAREFIDHLAVEIKSNPRLGVVQLFGSDSGFVVSHAILASRTGICDVVLIPEVPFSMKILQETILRKFIEKGSNHGLIVMAETAIPIDAMDYINKIDLSDNEKQAIEEYIGLRKKNIRIQGQTNDFLRTAGLKIVSRGIKEIEEELGEEFRVLTSEPRHLLRAIPPSTSDIIFGNRLGTLAVDNAMAGYTDFMISQWLTEYVLVPLKLVVLGRKRIPESGVFWKSVLAKTGQPENMVE